MNLDSARSSVVRAMKQVGFQLVDSYPDDPNPIVWDSNDFEVWVHYDNGDGKPLGKEPLYFEMKIEDGRIALYWQDFTHDTFVCYLDRSQHVIRDGLQKLYCHELDPLIAA